MTLQHWPQFVMIGLMLLSLMFNIGRHGKVELAPFDARHVLAIFIIQFLILYAGGFWGGM